MYDCAQVSIYISDDGKPVVQFTGTPLFMSLDPVGKAVALRAAKQLCDMIVNAIIEQNPDVAQDITSTLQALDIEPHDTSKFN